jgi:hypothetical protein
MEEATRALRSYCLDIIKKLHKNYVRQAKELAQVAKISSIIDKNGILDVSKSEKLLDKDRKIDFQNTCKIINELKEKTCISKDQANHTKTLIVANVSK